MNHKFEFLRNISHNWQRERKEEKKEKRCVLTSIPWKVKAGSLIIRGRYPN